MGSPQQRISPSKESRSRPIRNSKTQENQDLPTAFLQNRILARVKSLRQINRFRILHGRLKTCGKFAALTRPPITLLLSTSLTSDAIAKSAAAAVHHDHHHHDNNG